MGVSSWTLQLCCLWGSEWGVYCRVLSSDLKYKTDAYIIRVVLMPPGVEKFDPGRLNQMQVIRVVNSGARIIGWV
jgi:hypothetical protein